MSKGFASPFRVRPKPAVSPLATESTMTQDRVKRVVSRVVNLPALPQVVSTVISLTDDPNYSVAAITEAISRDPSISAKILKLVNSAFYGFPSKISSLSQAVGILGSNTVRSVTLSASVFDAFRKKEKEDGGFDQTACWIHSSSAAFIARYLAGRLGGLEAEEAFAGGLLHDLGKVILDAHMGGEFAEAVRLSEREGIPAHEAEQQVLGATHAEVGAWLIQNWKLPESLGRAVSYHHSPDAAPDGARKPAAVLCLADALSHLHSAGGEITLDMLPGRAVEIVGLDGGQLSDILARTGEEVEKAKLFFGAMDAAAEPAEGSGAAG